MGIGVVLAGLIIGAANQAHALECRQINPALNFSTGTTGTQYIRTKSSSDLTKMHGGAHGAIVGGLGGGELGFNMEMRFEMQMQGNAACVSLKAVDMKFYAKPQIHIANNFSRSSCEYNAVMAHEKKHVTTLLKFHREYAPKIRGEVVKMLNVMDTTIGPMKKSDTEKAQDLMQQRLTSAIKAYNALITKDLARRQQKIDNPAEYAKVTAQCDRWGQKLDSTRK